MVRKFYEADGLGEGGGSTKLPVRPSFQPLLVEAVEKLNEAHRLLAKSDLTLDEYSYYSKKLTLMKGKLNEILYGWNAD